MSTQPLQLKMSLPHTLKTQDSPASACHQLCTKFNDDASAATLAACHSNIDKAFDKTTHEVPHGPPMLESHVYL